MTGYDPAGYYETGCRNCGHTDDEHRGLHPRLCYPQGGMCACPGWKDQPTLAERITSPLTESRSIKDSPPPTGYTPGSYYEVITAEQWVLPMHAAQRLAMICDDLAGGRNVPYSGPASLLQYLPQTDPQPPCGTTAPISGQYLCDRAGPCKRGTKHHAVVGTYEVLWPVI
jgi:hypothetical protein